MVIHSVKTGSAVSQGEPATGVRLWLIMASYLEQSIRKLRDFEGSIPWMYRDTVGKVTVAVGLMLPNEAAAQRLPLMIGERRATEAEIAIEFARVNALAKAHPASFYREKGGLELRQTDIDSLLRVVLVGFEDELRVHLHGYDAMPDGVKLALLDMAYNLGPAGLVHGYPQLLKAIGRGAWAQAAAASVRRGPSAARNKWTREMFLENVVQTVKAEAESVLRRLLYGLIGMAAALWAAKKSERLLTLRKVDKNLDRG